MTALRYGSRDGYSWLWARDAGLYEVIDAVPELVLGQFVAITAFDSGPLRPNATETASGWRMHGKVAISPRVEEASALPTAGFDEWYVMPAPKLAFIPEVFVNHLDFSPIPDASAEKPETLRYLQERTERFWDRLRMIEPLAFLAENNAGLSIIVRDDAIFGRVLEAVQPSA